MAGPCEIHSEPSQTTALEREAYGVGAELSCVSQRGLHLPPRSAATQPRGAPSSSRRGAVLSHVNFERYLPLGAAKEGSSKEVAGG